MNRKAESRAFGGTRILWGWAALAGLLALAFLPVVAGKATLLPLQPGVMPDGPYGYRGPRPKPHVFDPAASAIKFVPYMKLVSEEWRGGSVPLWNPYAGGGVPLLANAEAFATAPLRLPLYLHPSPAVWNGFWLGRLLLAGGLAFMLALHLGLSFVPALVAGTAWMLGGYLVLCLNQMQIDVCVLLPGLILAADRLLLAPSRGRFAALALVFWGMCMGGNPQALVAGCALCLFTAGTRLAWLARRDRPGAMRRTALALAAGLAGAQVQWIPLFEFLRRAYTQHEAGSGRSGSASIPLASALNLPGPWAAPEGGIPFYYAGIAVLVLALAGIVFALRRRSAVPARPLFLALGAAFLLDFAKIFGFPGLHLLGALPVLEYVWWVKYAAPLALALALLAGLGAEALSGLLSPRRRTVAALFGLVVVAAELMLLRPGPLPAPHDPLAPAPYITWLKERQAEDPGAYLCGVGTALMPMTATAFRLKDIRMEDTLIDQAQYKILYEGISAPKPPRYNMFITLDELTPPRLAALRKLGVKWLVSAPGWRPAAGVADALSPAYDAEMKVWRVSGSTPFPGFPQRGKGAFMLGLWISLCITPVLVWIGLKRAS